MRAFLLLALFAVVGCGMTHEATGGTDNEVSGEVVVRIEIAFPTCEGIQDDALIVECVKAASEIIISVQGIEGLNQDQIDILGEIDGVVNPANLTGGY